jgi:hypothetical protein
MSTGTVAVPGLPVPVPVTVVRGRPVEAEALACPARADDAAA